MVAKNRLSFTWIITQNGQWIPHRSLPPLYRDILSHDDVIKWKQFPLCWPFVRGIHRSPVNSPHKGQWREALMFSLICAWIKAWVNNREAGDLRLDRGHYDVIVMYMNWTMKSHRSLLSFCTDTLSVYLCRDGVIHVGNWINVHCSERPIYWYHDLSLPITLTTLQWHHNGRDAVSNHQPHDCLLNRLLRRRSKKTPKLRVTGLCAGNSPGTGEFSAQRASNAENVSIWWRHHETINSWIVVKSYNPSTAIFNYVIRTYNLWSIAEQNWRNDFKFHMLLLMA